MRSPGTEAAAISARPWRAPLLGAVAWLLGLALIAGLIGAHGFSQIAAALALAGWSMVLIGVVHLGVPLADTLGWRALLRPLERPGFGSILVRRWIGGSINGLLPAAQIGGDIVRAHLLARAGVAGPVAGASVVIDLTVGLTTQLAFVFLGLGLLLGAQGDSLWLLRLGAGLGVLALAVLGFAVLQQRGLFARFARMVERATRNRAWQGLVGNAASLDAEVVARYRDRAAVAGCATWRLIGWLWGSAEIWLGFWLLGHPIALAEAVALESLGQGVRSVGFVLPGGLGAQESGIVAAALVVGIGPDLALAVALVKRARELCYGLPGLIAWAVLHFSGQRAAAPGLGQAVGTVQAVAARQQRCTSPSIDCE